MTSAFALAGPLSPNVSIVFFSLGIVSFPEKNPLGSCFKIVGGDGG